MNGGADLGGMMGFGPVAEEPNEPNFHANWEARTMAMVIAMGSCGQWNLDQSRFARESMQPDIYQSTPYYGIWYQALTKLMLERGMATADEIVDGKLRKPPIVVKGRMDADHVSEILHRGGPCNRPVEGKPAFAPTDAIVTENVHPESHTRLPRYARGRRGKIAKVLGFHVFPDSNAKDEGENPQWLYQVSFTAQELWGEDKNPRDKVTLDLWEPYLKPDA